MAVLTSKTQAGGAVGDTFEGLIITRVIADTEYVWNKDTFIDEEVVEIKEVADEAARLAETELEVGDERKQTDTGEIWKLKATPATSAANWVLIGAGGGIDGVLAIGQQLTADRTIEQEDHDITIAGDLGGGVLTQDEIVIRNGRIRAAQFQLEQQISGINSASQTVTLRLNGMLSVPVQAGASGVHLISGNTANLVNQNGAVLLEQQVSHLRIYNNSGADAEFSFDTGTPATDVVDAEGNIPANITVPNGATRFLEFGYGGSDTDGTQNWVLVNDSGPGVVEGLAATTIDSSASATTETLATSTGGTVVRLFTNLDVTNTATLAVQSGETLNGVTDGTFLFSNYTAGTQFRADEVAGGWVVKPIGQGLNDTVRVAANIATQSLHLPAATGSQETKIYTLTDKTFAATIDVEVGEALNGVTDGVFTFSNYEVGTSFMAVDRSTGNWDLFVLGTSSSQQFGTAMLRELAFYNFVGAADTPLQFVTEDFNNSTSITHDGTSIWTLQPNITYKLVGMVSPSNTNNFGFRWRDQTAGAIIDGILGNGSGNGVGADREAVAYFTPTVVTNVALVSTGLTGLNLAGGYATIEEYSRNEAVLAGMVTPEPLAYFMANASTPFTATANTNYVVPIDTASLDTSSGFDSTAKAYTIPTTGRYTIHFTGSWQNQSSAGDDTQFLNVRKDGTSLETVRINPEALSDGEDSGYAIHYVGDFVAGEVIDMYVTGVDGVVSIFTAGQLSISQLPTSTVVMPDALDVEDREDVLAEQTGTVADGTSFAIPADLSEYSHLRFEAGKMQGVWFAEAAVPVDKWTGTAETYLLSHSTPTEFSLRAARSGNNAVMTMGGNTSQVLDGFRIIGVRAQKTVINTTDTPVDDQSTSGYFDIGNMRVQWGRGTTSGGALTVNYPQLMADNSHSIHLTAANGNSVSMMYNADTTTGFQAVARDNNGNPSDTSFSWQAIGLKP